MLVRDRFRGSETPFEGDRLLVISSLPQGAQVKRAEIKLEPVAPLGSSLFEETLNLPATGPGDWGATKVATPDFVEVDFHARRTLASAHGSNLNNASLQVDIGGLYVAINTVGAMLIPQDPNPQFTLHSPDGGVLPSLATNRFRLSLSAGNPNLDRVVVRTAPSNLNLRLGQDPTFWARPGELAHAENVPDFSNQLNLFLENAQVQDGYYQVPVTLHSDSLCRLDVTVEMEYIQTQSALPSGLTEANLTFDHSSNAQAGSGSIQVSLPAGARVLPGQTTARVQGSFENSQIVYGPNGPVQPAAAVKIDPGRAQATPLIFSAPLAVSSLDLLVSVSSRTAQLSLDLVEDADGKPWTQSLLPAPAQLGLDSEIAGTPTWVNAALPAEVQLHAGVRYWLVVQSLQGEVQWSVDAQSQVTASMNTGSWTAGDQIAADQANGIPLGLLYTDTGGLSWRAETAPGVSGPLVAYVHLRQPPETYQVPIELLVGAGSSAQRVSLERFRPLGRIDFRLDFDEFAQAFNRALSSAAAPAPPQGEHLRNGDMEQWLRIGDRIGAAFPLEIAQSASALARSPDGSRLYVGSSAAGSAVASFVEAFETACGDSLGLIGLGIGRLTSMVANSDGTRLLVTFANQMGWVDAERLAVSGTHLTLSGLQPRPAFSPDGSLLYLCRKSDMILTTGESIAINLPNIPVLALNVPALELAFLSQGTLSQAFVRPFRLPDGRQADSLAVSPDGSCLAIAAWDGANEALELHLLDSASGSSLRSPIALGSSPADAESPVGLRASLAYSPDGERLVALNHAAASLTIVETSGLAARAPIALSRGAESQPCALAVEPGGKRAFVAHFSGNVLTAINLDAGSEVSPGIPVNQQPQDLAILPGGERLYVADTVSGENQAAISVIPIGALVPAEWTLTAGRIAPVCVRQPYHLAAVLGDFFEDKSGPYSPSAISEVVPVAGGARYVLSFWGLASDPDAVAEIIWYGGDCRAQQIDRLPFETFAGDPDDFKAGMSEAVRSGRLERGENLAQLHRLVANAPGSASLAEVRFSVPDNQAAILDQASLQSESNSLSNGDLQQLDQGRLVGWTLAPQGAVGVSLVADAGQVRIRNNGTAVVAMQQTVEFSAGSPFNLIFEGRGSAGSQLQSEPYIQLDWLSASNQPTGQAVKVMLEPQGPDRSVRRGTAPPDAAQVTISMVLPPGSTLRIASITLEQETQNSVPVSFVAQAPGELNVSGMRVAYEIDPPPPPPVPPQGLCPPTPPSGAPGQTRHGCCFCPSCGEEDDMCNPEPVVTPGGAPALEGECCHCGARLTHPGGGQEILTAATRPPALSVALPLGERPTGVVVLARPAQPATAVIAGRTVPVGPLVVRAPAVRLLNLAPLSVVAVTTAVQPLPPPITAVPGLTAEHTAALTAAGLDTLEKLSKAKISKVRSVLAGVPPEQVSALLKEARQMQRDYLKKAQSGGA